MVESRGVMDEGDGFSLYRETRSDLVLLKQRFDSTTHRKSSPASHRCFLYFCSLSFSCQEKKTDICPQLSQELSQVAVFTSP